VKALVDFRDRDALRRRAGEAPVLIAHRGGAVGPDAPENSAAALRRAAAEGYAAVEVDVEAARDGVPVLFHADASGTLLRACGVAAAVADLTGAELARVRYRGGDEPIQSLEEALAACAALGLGVMLDVKAAQKTPRFLDQIAGLIRDHGLTRAAVTISHDSAVRAHLAGTVMFPVSREDERRVLAGERIALEGHFWFGLPERLPSDAVPVLQHAGALVVPAINTFRYPAHPPQAHRDLARQDVARLRAAKVDAYQIDAVYRDLFEIPAAEAGPWTE
jgi:hypothetical protein